MTGSDQQSELAEFATQQHRRIVGLLTLHTGDPGLAQELAQDATAKLCEHWPKVRGMQDPRAWLTRVALNLATSRYRRFAAERRAMARLDRTVEAVEPADPSLAIATRQALAQLPTRYRTVLILRFYSDLSVQETAQLMGCAEGTVKSLTARATASLRERHGNLFADLRTETA